MYLVNNTPLFWDWRKDFTDPSIPSKFSTEEEFVKYIYDGKAGSISASFNSLNLNRRITALRQQYGADVITIIYSRNYLGAGRGNGLASQIPGAKVSGYPLEPQADNAFMFLASPEFTGRGYLFSHELGHLLGLIHCRDASGIIQSVSGPQRAFCLSGYTPARSSLFIDLPTITGGDGNNEESLLLFGSPKLFLPGVFLAKALDEFSGMPNARASAKSKINGTILQPSAEYLDDNSITIKGYATNKLPNGQDIFKDPSKAKVEPIGSFPDADATATIDKYAQEVAGYFGKGPSVEISNVPRSLQKGECATITVKLTACEPGNYYVRYFAGTNTTRLTSLTGDVIYPHPTLPGTYTFTQTICIPNDGSKFTQGFFVLQQGDGTISGTSSLASQQYFVPCSDCWQSTMTAFDYKTSGTLSSSVKKQRQGSSTANGENYQAQLYQNSPNPAKDKADIRFFIPKRSQVKLQLYNTLGQQINTFVDTIMDAGEYVVPMDIQYLPNGFYIYRLTVDDEIFMRTMAILR